MAVDKTKIQIGQVSGGVSGNKNAVFSIFYNGISTDWAVSTDQEKIDLAALLREYGIYANDAIFMQFKDIDGTQSHSILLLTQETEADLENNPSKIVLLECETKTFTGTTPAP